MSARAWLARWLFLLLAACAAGARAEEAEADLTLQGQYWVDETGRRTIAEVAEGGVASLQPITRNRAWRLGSGALWMRMDLPALDPAQRWYVLLTGGAFINRASLFTRGKDGRWLEQQAGDHVPVAAWSQPNFAPLFTVPAGAPATVWLRVENRPAPTSLHVQLLTEESLESTRQWTYLLVGGYLGFVLLVFIVGLIHGRLYGDRVFHVYCTYVVFMLLFQLSYTGMGGLVLWPEWAGFNDAAPALFMCLMVASGIWNIREATALRRHSRVLDRGVIGFCIFGVLFAPVYVLANGPISHATINLYGLASVVLSITLCLWTWRKGERYSGWLFIGFLPIHLAYPFPALRAAGLLADSWATQYAVLIGSAIEIPLLLYVLHWRAKDFSENTARMRVLETTDPLTGLPVVPVLRLRLRDALRRARRAGHRCSVLMVELVNHGEITEEHGREAAERALVVAASRMSSVIREVDTVSRVAETRFAMLLEGPQPEGIRRTVAQHLVARGLEPLPANAGATVLKFRIVSAWVPHSATEPAMDAGAEEQRIFAQLHAMLDRLLRDGRKVVDHLPAEPASAGQPDAVAA